jgi:hypothetical protein
LEGWRVGGLEGWRVEGLRAGGLRRFTGGNQGYQVKLIWYPGGSQGSIVVRFDVCVDPRFRVRCSW